MEKSCNVSDGGWKYVGDCVSDSRAEAKNKCMHMDWEILNRYDFSKKCMAKCCRPIESFSYTTSVESSDCSDGQGFFQFKNLRLKVTTVEEVPMITILDLFGLIGGYLGLFVGISLTTVVEFFEFSMRWFHEKIFRRRTKIQCIV